MFFARFHCPSRRLTRDLGFGPFSCHPEAGPSDRSSSPDRLHSRSGRVQSLQVGRGVFQLGRVENINRIQFNFGQIFGQSWNVAGMFTVQTSNASGHTSVDFSAGLDFGTTRRTRPTLRRQRQQCRRMFGQFTSSDFLSTQFVRNDLFSAQSWCKTSSRMFAAFSRSTKFRFSHMQSDEIRISSSGILVGRRNNFIRFTGNASKIGNSNTESKTSKRIIVLCALAKSDFGIWTWPKSGFETVQHSATTLPTFSWWKSVESFRRNRKETFQSFDVKSSCPNVGSKVSFVGTSKRQFVENHRQQFARHIANRTSTIFALFRFRWKCYP